MSRGQLVVLGVFLAICAGFVALFADGAGTRRRPVVPAWADREDPAPASSARPDAPTPTGPDSMPYRVQPAPSLGPVVVMRADGVAVAERDVRLVGGRVLPDAPRGGIEPVVFVLREAAEVWAGAAGSRWARIDGPLAAATPPARLRVRLDPAGPAIAVTVVEADGTPAADVPVSWPGPDGRPLARRTDAMGRVAIDDQPRGLVVAEVGERERGGPTLALRVGVDAEARAVLDPPLVVTGRVLDATGAPVSGAVVAGRVPEGPAGRDVRTGVDGAFRWQGRATDRLVLVAEADTAGAVAIEPPLPDATGRLELAVDLRLPASTPTVTVGVDLRSLPAGAFAQVRVEPAVLALVREAFAPGDVVRGVRRVPPRDGRHVVRDGALGGPVRVSVEGDVVAEDHLLAPAGRESREVRVEPRPAPPGGARAGAPSALPPAVPEATAVATPGAKPPALAALVGRVVDAAGLPLADVTVAVRGTRVRTDATGRFTLPGLPAGERVEAVYGYVDGADPAGGGDPRAFAPWFAATARPGGEAIDLVLPRAASATFRAVRGLDGVPLAWVRALVLDGEASVRFDGIVPLVDGRGRLERLVPGTAGTLVLLAPGLRREVALALAAGTAVDAGEVSLVRGGRVEGVVKTVDGAPIAGATVAALDDEREAPSGRLRVRARDAFLRRTTTDAKGAFVLDGLDPARPVGLAVYAPGLAPSARRILLAPDGTAKATITLLPGATIRLRIVDAAGAPVRGAAVELRDARTGVRWLDVWHRAAWGSQVGSDEDVARATAALWTEDPARPGLQRIGPIEPGPYDLLVASPGYRPATARYAVADATPGSADNPLRLPLDTMEWRVVLEPEPASGR